MSLKDDIRRLYFDENLSVQSITERLEICKSLVYRNLGNLSLHKKEENSKKLDELIKQDQSIKMRSISRKLGWSTTKVRRHLDELGYKKNDMWVKDESSQ